MVDDKVCLEKEMDESRCYALEGRVLDYRHILFKGVDRVEDT